MTALNAAPADLAEVERIVRAAGTSFHRGMRILPPDRRAAMYAIYAFCRIVDDIADEPGTHTAKAAQLDAWRARIAALYHGHADTPVTRVLLPAIAAYHLRQADFEAIIDGMQSDADTIIVAPTLAALDLYCDQVAAAVGRLSVRAFGDETPAADAVAHALGRALQHTNILRDLHEDADRGRLYLPAEWLTQARIPLDPRAALAHPDLPELCTRMAQTARTHFAQSQTAMTHCNPTAMRPARVMAASYQAILDALERRGWTHLDQPVRVTRPRKLWIAIRAMVG